MIVGKSGVRLLFPSQRVKVDLNVHEPHLTDCLDTLENWNTAPLLHLARPQGHKATRSETSSLVVVVVVVVEVEVEVEVEVGLAFAQPRARALWIAGRSLIIIAYLKSSLV